LEIPLAAAWVNEFRRAIEYYLTEQQFFYVPGAPIVPKRMPNFESRLRELCRLAPNVG
jgi:hypothetical protein